jgi:LmbE family N-acetylglucosaminyl deacetylase
MARITTNNNDSSSNHYDHLNMYNATANVKASCYIVNSSSASLQGFHYSTTGAGGAEWYS